MILWKITSSFTSLDQKESFSNMQSIPWGSLIITLLLPFQAALWLFAVIRRRSALEPVSNPYGGGARAVAYLSGFVVSWFFGTYLGLYLLSMLKDTQDSAAGTWTSFAGLFIAGLLGALLPYRLQAREGKRSAWGWVAIAGVYVVLYYLAAQILR
jgi:hypothetical protein